VHERHTHTHLRPACMGSVGVWRLWLCCLLFEGAGGGGVVELRVDFYRVIPWRRVVPCRSAGVLCAASAPAANPLLVMR